jgi:hypothetical protein
MKLTYSLLGFACSLLLVSPAPAQEAVPVLRDLDDKNPKTLTAEEIKQLLPGAKMKRVTPRGWVNTWTNEPGGQFIVSAFNLNPGMSRSTGGSSSRGKWHMSDDGRYCVLIEWVGNYPTEEWCRYVLQTSDGYYLVKSDKLKTEKVYKMEISK